MKPIMIIGGTDSSGGAGLIRDAWVAQKLGCQVLPIVTAVTAQSDDMVFNTQLISTEMLASQIKAALATTAPAAIKIGMLGNEEIANAVGNAIHRQSCPIVLDPVLKASSGRQLMSGQFPRTLLSQAQLVTPNLLEAAALSGYPVAETDDQIAAQADWFLSQGAQAVLIKGGHASGETSDDHLYTLTEQNILTAPRLEVATMRGTGCAMATAIACGLIQWNDLILACKRAKSFVHNYLREAINI
ncbi:bifunctional hydroxymethylpyrimidine kinase/phosphomethylpyrimidine kinase [Ruegeria conchae]|uniref:hydroxymethylpyrimidine kinase n=1 Tax=Ruegeria conchae TaxID=981384 RepID=A0A497ZH75_9RHOB|nr:hydroxymethylpyrimidine/phosphomethylpyrimidine kinase [Ruegeria conchae]RLK08049.1 hydroxymethylpyrimidine kinase /phosphomethylpyrimidine kinase [Ruegeria conchae]